MNDQLQRIEKKLDLILRLQGVELGEIESIASAQMDEAAIQGLTAKLKASGDALAVSVSTNKPK